VGRCGQFARPGSDRHRHRGKAAGIVERKRIHALKKLIARR